ncbi:MAG: 4-(cytidine 5'-diphospho)-2-C-methyl-D-erythritol kinase, partial [Methyloceanibacter sp.]
MTALRDTARAKFNLTLEVLGRRADGFHEVRSLVAFAELGDHLTL